MLRSAVRTWAIALCAVVLTSALANAAKPIPNNDPSARKVWRLKPELKNTHPRLLVTPEELPELRSFYKSAEAKPWRDKVEAYLGASKTNPGSEWLKDATDGQRQGFWRLPTVALDYLMTGDKRSLEACEMYMREFLKHEDWETGSERSSGMSAANIMVGAALAYDWCYNDLDPQLREKFGEKLFEQARKMYYGGHLNYNNANAYWQNDPANNHRWHRNAGLTLAMLAVYEEKPEQQWMMEKTMEDLEFVRKWLPHDGSCHEGPNYFTFGGNHLTVAFDAADTALGSDLMQADYFKNAGHYRLHTLTPGMGGIFSYGDGGVGSLGSYNNFTLAGASINEQPDVLDGLRRFHEKEPKSFGFGWFSILWDTDDLPSGNMENLHTKALFEDVGFAVMRDSWKDDAVAASFKCGPWGGYDLMRYSNSGRKYVNVAHDDPDANSFLIAKGDTMVALPDGYSKHKASQNHNTILINDLGQMTIGREEGGVWSQPSRSNRGEMARMAYLTAFKDEGKITAVEGEASGSYLEYSKGSKSRPDLDRFRRTFLWVEGDYILVLDDIRAPKDVDVTWLIQSKDIETRSSMENRFDLKADNEAIPMQLVSDQSFQTDIVDSPADNRGKPMGLRQLRAEVEAEHVRFASVYDPWGRGLTVELVAKGPELTWVQVSGAGFRDVWKWEAPKDNETASSISLDRRGSNQEGQGFAIGPEDTEIMWQKLALN